MYMIRVKQVRWLDIEFDAEESGAEQVAQALAEEAGDGAPVYQHDWEYDAPEWVWELYEPSEG